MTEAPELFVNETIRLPFGYGPGIYDALRRPLFVESYDGRAMDFIPSGAGLAGYALRCVRDLGVNERGREIEVEFQTGLFGFKPLLKQLNVWAISTHGVEAFSDTLFEKHEHFVSKSGARTMVRLLLTSPEDTITIPVYNPAERSAVQATLRGQAAQAAGAIAVAKVYFDSYQAAKVTAFRELTSIVASRWPDLSEAEADAMAALASNEMSGEFSDVPLQILNDQQRLMAETLGREQFETSESLRKLSLDAAYALALSKLMQAPDLRCGIVDNGMIHQAIVGLTMLIERGPTPSLYLATLAQCYFTQRNGPAAYEAACRAVEADPMNAEAWRLKGNGAWNDDHRGEALEYYERAKTIDPAIQGIDEAVVMIRAELAQGAPR
jgi:tetratricopeptide (TPR) repeat protein